MRCCETTYPSYWTAGARCIKERSPPARRALQLQTAAMFSCQPQAWLVLFLAAACNACASDSYVAAVYEHVPIFPKPTDTPVTAAEALELMNKNMDVLEPQIKAARKQGANIIVTPEFAMNGFDFTRETVFRYLEDIPHPSVDWIPCSDPKRFGPTPVQERLSCMAKNSSIYLVANIGDKKTCNSSDATCRKDGYRFYNTIVAYDSDGKFLARYHKYHLFYEDYFDRPETPEHVFFDTPFGRFGLCTCFDILFREPAMGLIEDYHVKDFCLPVAWVNLLPHHSSIEIFSGWAMAMGRNVLAANINKQSEPSTGSGVFQSNYAASYYYNKDKEEGHLVIANVTARPEQAPLHTTVSWNRYATSIPRPCIFENVFTALVMDDNFTFVELRQAQGNYSVCYNDLCCHLTYSMTEKRKDEVYALGAFDGMITGKHSFYTQICTLLKCKTTDLQTCGQPTEESSTTFKSVSLSGTFETNYIFPHVLFNGSKLGIQDFKILNDGRLVSKRSFSSKPLITATLYGRCYDKDPSSV